MYCSLNVYRYTGPATSQHGRVCPVPPPVWQIRLAKDHMSDSPKLFYEPENTSHISPTSRLLPIPGQWNKKPLQSVDTYEWDCPEIADRWAGCGTRRSHSVHHPEKFFYTFTNLNFFSFLLFHSMTQFPH